MLSLNNTYNEEEVYAFDERVLKGLGTVRFALTRFGRWKF
jgi:NAD-dependent DNA ligase